MYEVEYNFGRMFHQLGRVPPKFIFLHLSHQRVFLGLYSHAVKHY